VSVCEKERESTIERKRGENEKDGVCVYEKEVDRYKGEYRDVYQNVIYGNFIQKFHFLTLSDVEGHFLRRIGLKIIVVKKVKKGLEKKESWH
jgi:hypothetical protein